MLRGQNAMHYSRARLITHIYYAMLHLTLHTKRTERNTALLKAIHETTVEQATKLIRFLASPSTRNAGKPSIQTYMKRDSE